MFIRLIEFLLINIFNSAVRRRRAKKKEIPPVESALVAPADHIVIGHVLGHDEAEGDVIARDLLKGGIVALTPQARKRHLYVLGATGTGKTNLLLHLIESDIKNKRAFCVIDLRGDLVDRILLRLADVAPAEEWRQRLLLLDLRHNEQVVGFNPLSGEGEPYNRALHLLEVLKGQSDSWGVQLEETLRNSLIALAESGWSLLEIEPLLSNPAFRKEVLALVSDTHVKNFFERYEKLSAANQLTWSMAVLNKVTPLLAIPQLRLMFGQQRSFSFRKLMDNEPGMVILVSLAIDRLHSAAHLVGGLLISSLQTAIMARVDQPESDRVPVQLFCDEFEMMASDRFQEIVAEGRRFGVGLCLSHQNLTQLSPSLRNVLRNNVHTQIYFQTGATDAAELAKEITGSDSREDIRKILMSQDVGEAYLVRRAQPSIRMKTLHCPDPKVSSREVDAIKQVSRETYAHKRSDIERELILRQKEINALSIDPSIAATVAARVSKSGKRKSGSTAASSSPVASDTSDSGAPAAIDISLTDAPVSPPSDEPTVDAKTSSGPTYIIRHEKTRSFKPKHGPKSPSGKADSSESDVTGGDGE